MGSTSDEITDIRDLDPTRILALASDAMSDREDYDGSVDRPFQYQIEWARTAALIAIGDALCDIRDLLDRR